VLEFLLARAAFAIVSEWLAMAAAALGIPALAVELLGALLQPGSAAPLGAAGQWRGRRVVSELEAMRGGEARASAEAGWLRAERSETIHARPAACIAALTEFERHPEWQTYVTEVKVLARDQRRRGVRVWTRAMIGERVIEFTASYHFPSPNRILFAQDDGELEAARGSWGFRSAGGGRTRATCTLEVKPGWRLSLLLRGPAYERIREAVLDHLMGELRARVEDSRASRT
jgi:Polyketide cyclase / dehydrase and lipid transport